MSRDSDLALFARFFPTVERLEQFCSGKIYMSALLTLRNIEDNKLRGDKNEAIHSLLPFVSMAIQDPNSRKYVPITGAISPLVFPGVSPHGNALCFYTLSATGEPVDPSVRGFGKYGCILKDPTSFAKKLHTAAHAIGRKLLSGPIEYVDFDTHQGEVGAFRKSRQYELQKEFRFFLEDGNDKEITLDVGDLSEELHLVDAANLVDNWTAISKLVSRPGK